MPPQTNAEKNGVFLRWASIGVAVTIISLVFSFWLSPLMADVREATLCNARQDECINQMKDDLKEIKHDVKKLLERSQ